MELLRGESNMVFTSWRCHSLQLTAISPLKISKYAAQKKGSFICQPLEFSGGKIPREFWFREVELIPIAPK